MRSAKERIIAALDAAEASYRELASLPLDALSRPEKQELLKRLEELEKKMTAFDRRLTGQLIPKIAGHPPRPMSAPPLIFVILILTTQQTKRKRKRR
jgi:hypothetical protein